MSGRISIQQRALILFFIYSGAVIVSFWAAYFLRFDFKIPDTFINRWWAQLGWILPIKLFCLYNFGQFRSLLSYFSMPDLVRLLAAVGVSTTAMHIVRHVLGIQFAPPRAVILIDMVIFMGLLCTVRVLFRLLREYFMDQFFPQGKKELKQVAIVGAGDAGAALIRELHGRPNMKMRVVAVFDDNIKKHGSELHGVDVLGVPENLPRVYKEMGIQEVILAMPTAPSKRIRELVEMISPLALECRTVPSMAQLVSGEVQITKIRQVELEDLLGREPVRLDVPQIRDLLQGKVVMVTGAGGSIGSELCRQVAGHAPARILMVERSEVSLFVIEQEMIAEGFGSKIVPLVADILSEDRMVDIFKKYQPQIIFHAAAHKHVPMMEHQPAEAILNNSIGTARLAEWAIKYGVQNFTLISTDKAINPTNVMGATKRLAEIYLQSRQQKSDCQFKSVRFGNVLGSSGSVIPIFKKQIENGGPVTVTDPDVTRYFMTIPEAVGLVLQAATLGKGGDIFVLDMGTPLKIVDVARQLIRLSGMEPDRDIEIRFVGLRPGEKLFEELCTTAEHNSPTSHPRVFCFKSTPHSFDDVRHQISEIEKHIFHASSDDLKKHLQRIIPEYQPHLSQS